MKMCTVKTVRNVNEKANGIASPICLTLAVTWGNVLEGKLCTVN